MREGSIFNELTEKQKSGKPFAKKACQPKSEKKGAKIDQKNIPRRPKRVNEIRENGLESGRTNRRNTAKTSADRHTKVTLTLTIAGSY